MDKGGQRAAGGKAGEAGKAGTKPGRKKAAGRGRGFRTSPSSPPCWRVTGRTASGMTISRSQAREIPGRPGRRGGPYW